ncbi:tetratricopeptide repeat-containing sulfotransferase family protein [Microbulbifer litoralis]|uniref:tetratricopeptide repeat-containing sulfotransferase family protein n=1 Tax=Microbulbifer litoralis TaxID=2933965 RepID=UPI0020279EE8|nr:sulfotransferase [Microbulbifer sp. GX H0434]
MPEPNSAVLFQRARSSFSRGALAEARQLISGALAADPDFINAHRLAADIRAAMGEPEAACEILQRAAARLAPGSGRHTAVSLHLAGLLLQRGDLAGAASALKLEAILPLRDVRMLARAGYLYSCCEDHPPALAVYERALSLQPDNSDLLYNCAAANRAMGNSDRAEDLYDRVLASRAEDWEAYRNRSDLRKQTETHNHLDQLHTLLQCDPLPVQARVQLNFALAKELEDLGRSGESFDALQAGCRARRSMIQYDVGRDCSLMAAIRETFDAEKLGNIDAPGDAGEGIVLVLGMPRTGTTLVDRLLTSIPGVVSAGEPDTFARLLGNAIAQRHPDADTGENTAVHAAGAVDMVEWGSAYARQMRARADYFSGEVILDKNPMNFLYAGLIQRALPAAKIVHLIRDPLDTCYAVYKTLFKSAYPFSYDQLELARYYLGYRALMDHWRRALPGRFLDIHYERLVADPPAESRRLFAFCGLEWTESVLDFHRQKGGGTATASASQVRQPIYRSSVGRWKDYHEQLRPLIDRLEKSGVFQTG